MTDDTKPQDRAAEAVAGGAGLREQFRPLLRRGAAPGVGRRHALDPLNRLSEIGFRRPWLFIVAAFAITAVLYVPPIQRLFHFTTLHPGDLGICLACGLSSIMWFEVWKWLQRVRDMRRTS